LAEDDTRIDKLREELDKACAHRKSLQDFYDRCRAVVSPIRNIPPEILLEIFGACALGERSLGGRSLWNLVEVCSLWKGLVMETPALWSTIVVD
ncbi:hypothetical protein B0H17DRAFT_841197, partial [Mycena rosella]